MLVKPNNKYIGNDSNMENDLYRKFNAIFSEILHPDDSSYEIDTYCETKNHIEPRVNSVFNNFSDSIVPILGYTGMGKTYLMHYCIRNKYHINGVIKNKSFVVNNGRQKSVIIYASYDAHRADKSIDGRLAGKIAAASSEIIKSLGMDNKTKEGKKEISKYVAEYIRDNKAELLEENAPSTDALDIEMAENLYKTNQLAYEEEKIKWLLKKHATDIKEVIVVLDDIEGLVNTKKNNLIEYELIDTYLKMYDCLRREDDRLYKVKLFLCMRERTYNEVKKSAWYNTHRITNEPLFLSSGINLGEIFMKRFSALEKSTGILDDVKNNETWLEAKNVLNRLSNELERILGNGILELCNYNVCDAVQLFASILANRQWTQKSEKFQASFKIEEYHYYLSPASCFRAIAMKNSTVFENLTQLTNIFYNNDKVGYCLPIYILMMMNETGNNICELSLEQIQDNFIRVMKYEPETERIKRAQIEEIVQYFVERDILFEKVFGVGELGIESKFYVAPKGKIILKYFFDNTILLEIFRDDLFLDEKKHDVKCSNNLSREEMFLDVIKIIEEIGEEETRYFKTSQNKGTLNDYYRLWRNERISFHLSTALKSSLVKYYRDEIPRVILDNQRKVENEINKAWDEDNSH